MAGRCPPLMLTKPTPGNWEILAINLDSANFCMVGNGKVGEVRAKVKMAGSAGLILLYIGNCGRSGGNKLIAPLMAACTSCSATSKGSSRLNCKVITEAPSELVEDICFKPGILPNCRSNGAVMLDVTKSGLAPGYKVTTCMVG